MIPIVTPAQMAAVDASAPEPLEVLVGRAAGAVARATLRLLGGAYGRTVVLVCGPGNNGLDGRVAGQRLRRRGVRTIEIDVRDAPDRLPSADLVVDAAFGTGYRVGDRAPFRFPATAAPVLAVDVPSGIDGTTGARLGSPAAASATVTFQALKPGLLFGEGPAFAGSVDVVDIGLGDGVAERAASFLVTGDDVAHWWPRRARDSHKWKQAVRVVAGSSDMPGAAALVAAATGRAREPGTPR